MYGGCHMNARFFLYWLTPETVIFLIVYKCTIRISFPFLAIGKTIFITFTDGIVSILQLDSITHERIQTGWHLLTQTQSEWLIAGRIGRPWASTHFPRESFSPCHPCSRGWWDPGAMRKVQQEQSCSVSVPLKHTKKRMRNENFKWLLSGFTRRVLTQGMKYVSTVFQSGTEVSGVDLTHLPHTQRLWLPSLELRGRECDGKIPSLGVQKEEENVFI